jgi:hypothetical protein
MPRNRIFIAICCLLAFNVFAPSVARSSPVAITGLGVDNSAGKVSVGFSITVEDMAPLMDALSNGGDYEVSCTSRLYHRRAGFWNSFLSEASYSCILSSRPIARECQVQDHRGVRTFHFQDLKEDLNRHWSGLAIPMGSWDMIERGAAYRIVMTFSITRTNIPNWVSKPLFFVSWDLVPEIVYEFDFDF